MNHSELIQSAVDAGQNVLSEYDSKRVLSAAGVNVTKEYLVDSLNEAVKRAGEIGFPVVLKGVGEDFSHKSELGLVRLGISSTEEVERHYGELKDVMQDKGSVLVQETVNGKRELLAGAIRDEQYGPVVTFGLGGIFAEVLEDVSLRLAPLSEADAREMIGEIRSRAILGEIRGMESVDTAGLVHSLRALGQLCLDNPAIAEIDINPLIVQGSQAVAVDGLIILSDGSDAGHS